MATFKQIAVGHMLTASRVYGASRRQHGTRTKRISTKDDDAKQAKKLPSGPTRRISAAVDLSAHDRKDPPDDAGIQAVLCALMEAFGRDCVELLRPEVAKSPSLHSESYCDIKACVRC